MSKEKERKKSMVEIIQEHLGICEDCGDKLKVHGFMNDKEEFTLAAKCQKCGKIQ